MKPDEITWETILDEPFVLLVLGSRGSGKTALGHRLIEVFEGDDRDAYIMGFPSDREHLLPEWVDILPVGTSKEKWPEDSIVLIHEAHQIVHARRSMDVENLALDELVTVSRHKNSNIIYDTQQSQRLDRNAVASVDAICVRWPALLQEDFERRAVRPIIENAREVLEKYVTVHDEDGFTYVERQTNENGVDLLNKHAFIHAEQFVGEYPHPIELADHYTEDISKAYGEESDDSGGGVGSGYNSLDAVREDMADPEDVTEKDPDRVAALIEETGIGRDGGGGGGGSGGGSSGGGGGQAQQQRPADGDDEPTGNTGTARRWIRQMEQREQKVFGNNFPQPTVELMFPADMRDEVFELVKSHDLGGTKRRAFPQSPSTDGLDEEVVDGLKALQFQLQEGDTENLNSSGYDMAAIFDALEGEPFVVSKAPRVQADLPV